MKWNPIETAPRNETPILTDVGICLWANPKNWGSPIKEGWILCDYAGTLFEDIDKTYCYCHPQFWMELPKLPPSSP